MLAKRVIPTVLVRGRTAYKGPGFGEHCTRSIGDALAICKIHAARGVDELMILDIGATPEGRGPDLELVRALSAGCYIPITVGGGVQSIDDVDALLRAGADKVAVCSAAREKGAGFIDDLTDRFGRQAITVVIEHDSAKERDRYTMHEIPLSAGEIVMQCRDLDSKLSGYEFTLAAWLSSRAEVTAPVIISGGCSGPADMVEAFRRGISGCAAGALFAFTDCTPRDCAQYLREKGVEVRV